MRSIKLLLGLMSFLLLIILISCSSNNNTLQDSSQQTANDNGFSNPPIHVNFDRAGVSYAPAQIRHAYGLDQVSGDGTSQTIAIVDAFGSNTIQNDLNTFCKQYNIPSTAITIVYPGGTPKKADSGWALEIALDVEWAHAVAPGAKILLVVARSNSNTDLLKAVDYAALNANQVSMSWGGSEFSGMAALDSHFNKPGVSFFASSGDSGAGVEWPAVSQYVVGVGGTSLKLDSSNSRASETAWSGSGGGKSSVIVEPTFQGVWQSSGFREVPDVSYDADPYTGFQVYDSTAYQGRRGWIVVGGTSAGAPQWAAISAIANAGRASALASANASLYNLGSPANYKTSFFDIVTGKNGYNAGTGYDMVTGIGSPISNSLIPKLIALP